MRAIRLLYVDPDAEARGLLADRIRAEHSDMQVRTAVSGAGAREVLATERVDCLVSSLTLPDEESGVAFLSAIKTTNPSMPCILFTRSATPEILREAYAAEVTDVVFNDHGSPSHLVLTHRVRSAVAECNEPEQSAGREPEFGALVDAVSDVIVTIDEASTITFVNDAVEKQFGYSTGELVGESLTALMSDELADRHEAGIERYCRTGERHLDWNYTELTAIDAKGAEMPVAVSFGEFHRDTGREFIGVIRDVSEPHRIREALRQERNLKDRLLTVAPIGIAIVDPEGAVTYSNARALDILGLEKGELADAEYRASAFEVTDREGHQLGPDELPSRRVIESGETIREEVLHLERPDGQFRAISVNAAPLTGNDDQPDRAVLTLADVTESQRLETELKEIFRRITDAFFGLDRNWEFTYVNNEAERLLKSTEEELLGRILWEAYPEAVGTTFEEEYRRAMDDQEAVSFEEYYPPLDTWFAVRVYPSESGLSVYFRDVSRRKRYETHLAALNELAQEMMDGDTEASVAETAISGAERLLDMSVVAVFLLEEETGELRPAAYTTDAEACLEHSSLLDPSAGHEWSAFVENETLVLRDLQRQAAPNGDVVLHGGIVAPLGRHGVLAIGSTATDKLEGTAVDL